MGVGVVGLGIMGQATAERLLATGHEVTVHNRTRTRAGLLQAHGASWAATPADLAARTDVVISFLTDPAAVRSVALGSGGLLAGLRPDAVHCDMSTVTPQSAEEIADAYRAAGRRFVQAPVLGSKRQIADGSLLVLAGGSGEDTALCEPVWRSLAARVWHLPTAAQAAAAKLAANLLIAHMITGLGQSLLFAQKGGVAPSLVLDILGASAMGCPMFESKGRSLTERRFQANFVVRNMVKDLTLAEEAASSSGTSLVLGGLVRELFISADQMGWGQEDYSAVVKVLEALAGAELAP